MKIEFAGFRVTADGVKPSEQILKDIANFPEPTTLKEVRRWFGLIEQVAWLHSIGDTMHLSHLNAILLSSRKLVSLVGV